MRAELELKAWADAGAGHTQEDAAVVIRVEKTFYSEAGKTLSYVADANEIKITYKTDSTVEVAVVYYSLSDLQLLDQAAEKVDWRERSRQLLAKYLVRRLDHCNGDPHERFKKLQTAAQAFNLLNETPSPFFKPVHRLLWESYCSDANNLAGNFRSNELGKCLVEINKVLVLARKDKPNPDDPTYIYDNSNTWLGYELFENEDAPHINIFYYGPNNSGDVNLYQIQLNGYSLAGLKQFASSAVNNWQERAQQAIAKYIVRRLDHCKQLPGPRFDKLEIAIAALKFLTRISANEELLLSPERTEWNNIYSNAKSSCGLFESEELVRSLEEVKRELLVVGKIFEVEPQEVYGRVIPSEAGAFTEKILRADSYDDNAAEKSVFVQLIKSTPVIGPDEVNSCAIKGYHYADLAKAAVKKDELHQHWKTRAVGWMCAYLDDRLKYFIMGSSDDRFAKIELASKILEFLKTLPDNARQITPEQREKWTDYCLQAHNMGGNLFRDYLKPIDKIISSVYGLNHLPNQFVLLGKGIFSNSTLERYTHDSGNEIVYRFEGLGFAYYSCVVGTGHTNTNLYQAQNHKSQFLFFLALYLRDVVTGDKAELSARENFLKRLENIRYAVTLFEAVDSGRIENPKIEVGLHGDMNDTLEKLQTIKLGRG